MIHRIQLLPGQTLRKRLRNRPLAAQVDLTAFAISDRDMALLLKQLPLRPEDTDRGTGL
jgi:hypothetical protein